MDKLDLYGPDPEWDAIQKMTGEQLRQELIDEGLDPDEVVESMRRLGRVMAAKYADQIERERRMPREMETTFLMMPEAAAAGSPAWTGGDAHAERVSFIDLLARGGKDDLFCARVKGWSMRDAGINDGDVVLVNAKLEPKDGDVVLAHLASEGQVVKRLRQNGGATILESANPDFGPIVVGDASSLRIHGVVVGRAGSV